MSLDLDIFRGSTEWEFLPKGTPYHKVCTALVAHIVATGFVGVKVHKFLTLKQYWLLYIKNLGMPLEDTQGMTRLLSDVSYLLSEERILKKTLSLSSQESYDRILRPEILQRRIADRKKPILYYNRQDELVEVTGPYFIPGAYHEDDEALPDKPKRKRIKKGETGLEQLLGLDNLPDLF